MNQRNCKCGCFASACLRDGKYILPIENWWNGLVLDISRAPHPEMVKILLDFRGNPVVRKFHPNVLLMAKVLQPKRAANYSSPRFAFMERFCIVRLVGAVHLLITYGPCMSNMLAATPG